MRREFECEINIRLLGVVIEAASDIAAQDAILKAFPEQLAAAARERRFEIQIVRIEEKR